MSLISEPRNGRGLSVEGHKVYPYEAETERHVTNFVREIGLGRPYFVGFRPCTWGEFKQARWYSECEVVSPLYIGRVCIVREHMPTKYNDMPTRFDK